MPYSDVMQIGVDMNAMITNFGIGLGIRIAAGVATSLAVYVVLMGLLWVTQLVGESKEQPFQSRFDQGLRDRNR